MVILNLFFSNSLFNEMVSIGVFLSLFFQFAEKDCTLPLCLCSKSRGGGAAHACMAHSMIDFII
jgi:hypothetical protein